MNSGEMMFIGIAPFILMAVIGLCYKIYDCIKKKDWFVLVVIGMVVWFFGWWYASIHMQGVEREKIMQELESEEV
jgi:hypothetical protein